MLNRAPTVLITIGDPSGSGPELALRTALSREVQQCCQPVLIGAPQIIQDGLHSIKMTPSVEYITEDLLSERRAFAPERLYVFPLGNLSPLDYEKGTPSAPVGHHVVDVARAAIRLARAGLVDAICSAPSSKVSLNLAGYKDSVLTDMLLGATGTKRCETMLILDKIRLIVATYHVPLRTVADLLTRDRVASLIEVLEQALTELFRIPKPRIGVAGLNPHASDGGLYGNEEASAIRPAIEMAQQKGIAACGPIPGDFLVPKIQAGELDGGVTLYHDQAHAPLKVLGLYKPATLLLGVPLVRTSVAHGTAIGKARAGNADPSGMINACSIAAEIAKKTRLLQ
jgi:4-phospho-D-threonate 3-dehydrogenase / 4-phospho-D-erythronate 3-dehydrogenase